MTDVSRRNWLAGCSAGSMAALCTALASRQASAQETETEVADTVVLLQAVGGLCVGHVQTTLGFIGVTADAFQKEAYTAEGVEDLVGSVISVIDVVKSQLGKVQDLDLTADDAAFMENLQTLYTALQKEANALIAYAKSKKPKDAEAFEKARKAAVGKYEELLQSVSEGE